VTYRNDRLLKAVRALPCTSCGIQDGTVCAAHSNQGKGMGIKSSDATIIALCYQCHSQLDQGGRMAKAERREFERDMNLRTLHALIEREILVVGNEHR
jgi:hypothetical protein